MNEQFMVHFFFRFYLSKHRQDEPKTECKETRRICWKTEDLWSHPQTGNCLFAPFEPFCRYCLTGRKIKWISVRLCCKPHICTENSDNETVELVWSIYLTKLPSNELWNILVTLPFRVSKYILKSLYVSSHKICIIEQHVRL